MKDKTSRQSGDSPWSAYHPSPAAPWDVHRVVHLHRCAGFGATRAEIDRDLRDGPEASVTRFLNGRAQDSGVLSDHEALAVRLGDAAVDSREPERLKAWWVWRMLASPDPLRERLVLMWHNHFATSNNKVDDLGAMRRQNDLFRQYARAPFGNLLNEALHDPALLLWLDAAANRKGHPNENLARELMELFTLGIGHFNEDDVKNAARALTGWTVYQGSFFENVAAHDPDKKTILGKSGRWTGTDLLQMLIDHPATSHRLATRLCSTFLGEGAVAPAALDELALGLRAHSLDIGWAVATILRSRAFFATSSLGTRVVGPVEFVVGAVRALECLDPLPNTVLLARWITHVGQDLFFPPNVGGWPGGRAWFSTRGTIARANFATALVSGRDLALAEPVDVLRLTGQNERSGGLENVVAVLTDRLIATDPGASWRKAIMAAAQDGSPPVSQSARRAAALVISAPEAQLA